MPPEPLVRSALELGWITSEQAARFEGAPVDALVLEGILTGEQLDELRRRVAETAPAEGPRAPHLPPPRRLGKYELLERVGAGGMAEVWRARDAELDRIVALKVVRSADERLRRRLLREAETAARLDHPGIVPIYDAGEADEAAYVAMRFIVGATLEDAALDLRGRVAALRDAARALHFAHGRGVVHRDIKPSNILVENGRAFVVDFGMAKRHEVDTSLSATGAVIGTAAYMPPEQADGRAGEGDARSDVYSLGATLYELAVGRPPFVGDSFVAVLMQVLHDEPKPPRKIRPNLSADLEATILKAIEKDPDRRYADAEALGTDLERWLRGEPVRARRGGWRRTIARLALHRRAAVLAAAAAAALAAAAWFAFAALHGQDEAAAIDRIRSPLNIFKPGPGMERILDSAIDDFDEAVRRFPESARARWYRGIWRMLRGEYKVAARLDPSPDLRGALEDFAWLRERGGVPLDAILFHEGLANAWRAHWALARIRRGQAGPEELAEAAEAALSRFAAMLALKPRPQWSDHLRIGQLELSLAEGALLANERPLARARAAAARETLRKASAEGDAGLWQTELTLSLARERILAALLHDGEGAREAEELLQDASTSIPQEQAERLLLRAQLARLRGDPEGSRELARAAFLIFPAWEAEWPELR
jgi:predicted Ser/Thr protein kinase